jgi:hypothetical protein
MEQMDEQHDRVVSLIAATSITDDVPLWAWEYADKGRIQLGTLALFAGRPGAGKSTAARWFAAAFSTGTLAGHWVGKPQNIAYIAPAEESVKYIVKPGLRAAGADLGRIYFPEVQRDGRQVRLLSIADEEQLTAQLKAHGITVVIVDPLMDTIAAGVDINRNNEVRAVVEPWSRMAEKIDGIVLGVAHLKKATNGDVVAGINASSAFGEVARAVFGFAKDPETDGDRIMSQAKNSTGEEDLAVTYRIESQTVTTDSGKSADVGRFVITGDSDRSVGDVLRDGQQQRDGGSTGAATEAQAWLEDYVSEHQPVWSKVVKDAGRTQGFSPSTIDRAARKIAVIATADGFPRKTFWSLAQSHQGSPKRDGGGVTDATDATGADLHVQSDVTATDSAVTSVTSRIQLHDATDATGAAPRESDITDPVEAAELTGRIRASLQALGERPAGVTDEMLEAFFADEMTTPEGAQQ